MLIPVSIVVLTVACIVLALFSRLNYLDAIEAKKQAEDAALEARQALQQVQKANARATFASGEARRLQTWARKLTEYLRETMPKRLGGCPHCDDVHEGHKDE